VFGSYASGGVSRADWAGRGCLGLPFGRDRAPRRRNREIMLTMRLSRTALVCVVVLALGTLGFALGNTWLLILAGLGGCVLLADTLSSTRPADR
jgi:hypothetical protein